ncbi:MAG: hypothetical protein QOD75_1670 [Blastocatellia bacterium]|jgi:hypothetical protein|nr:hypothetical protein [Blastocatellia bacterium]
MRGKRLAIKVLVYFVLALVLAGLVLCVGASLNKRAGTIKDAHAANENQETSPQLPRVPENNAVTDGEYGYGYQKYAAKWVEPTALLTIALVVGVFVTARIYKGQLQKMTETVALLAGQSSTMREQLGAMKDQAAHAAGQLDSLITAERAYVGITEMIPILEIGKRLVVTITCRNGGRTPAWEVGCTASVDIDEKRIVARSDYPEGAFFLPSGFEKPMEFVFDLVLTDELLIRIEKDTSKIICLGEVTYRDFRWEPKHSYLFYGIFYPKGRRFEHYDADSHGNKRGNPN